MLIIKHNYLLMQCEPKVAKLWLISWKSVMPTNWNKSDYSKIDQFFLPWCQLRNCEECHGSCDVKQFKDCRGHHQAVEIIRVPFYWERVDTRKIAKYPNYTNKNLKTLKCKNFKRPSETPWRFLFKTKCIKK